MKSGNSDLTFGARLSTSFWTDEYFPRSGLEPDGIGDDARIQLWNHMPRTRPGLCANHQLPDVVHKKLSGRMRVLDVFLDTHERRDVRHELMALENCQVLRGLFWGKRINAGRPRRYNTCAVPRLQTRRYLLVDLLYETAACWRWKSSTLRKGTGTLEV